jgi:phospholipase C
VPPPLAVSPSRGTPPGEFAFDRYGIRVPAVIISPYIARGRIVRSALARLPHRGPPYPFDHTTIIKTLFQLFDLGEPLTARDTAAPDLLGWLSLTDPENDGPPAIAALPVQPTTAEVIKLASAPPNKMQEAMCKMAAHLPRSAAVAGAHIAALQAGSITPTVPSLPTVRAAGAFATARMRGFLNS